MKKKLLIAITCLMAAAMLGGCGETSSTATDTAKETVADTTTTTAAKVSDSGDLGDYSVTIKSAVKAKDYEDKDAIVVTYSFKNNSDKEAMFSTAISTEAFQDGVQLETGISMDSKVVDAGDSLKKIQKGGSLEVKKMYLLSNTTSDVTVNAKELISLADTKLTKIFVIK